LYLCKYMITFITQLYLLGKTAYLVDHNLIFPQVFKIQLFI
jgi:hypothetical protein